MLPLKLHFPELDQILPNVGRIGPHAWGGRTIISLERVLGRWSLGDATRRMHWFVWRSSDSQEALYFKKVRMSGERARHCSPNLRDVLSPTSMVRNTTIELWQSAPCCVGSNFDRTAAVGQHDCGSWPSHLRRRHRCRHRCETHAATTAFLSRSCAVADFTLSHRMCDLMCYVMRSHEE